ncbi:hypothetical protein M6B38_103310 [Iris pallida]|uniref:Uncharacterized protein n=1 Tax=Iris pallida TaxID=29817 RepID=A0AAX6FCJ5_IRIPA|nr:hypothetical protein M6B38_142795 [Iris pallida]KAJ6813969.1 hypothetical protein M6B38_103310 [Iris pallida]
MALFFLSTTRQIDQRTRSRGSLEFIVARFD